MVSQNGHSPVLKVDNLVTRFYTPEGVVHAVNGVSFELNEGETLGVVGESGCGKSVTMLSILKLIAIPPGKIESGSAVFHDKDLIQANNDEIRQVRGGQIAMIFQDPMTSLNPVLTVEKQVAEPLILHLGMTKSQARDRVVELLEMVGIPEAEKRLADYPHQFSGGMRQRVMIAMALSCNPQILIADEPTTALDVTIQAQIVDLVKRLRDEFGMSIIWITHDLGVVARLAQRVVVMYAGYVIEEAPVKELYSNPNHPYTLGLLKSLPRLDSSERYRLSAIQGNPPLLYEKPTICPFAPRCGYAIERCWTENPPLVNITADHKIACWWNVKEGKARNVR
jgi:oligopeptide transport system ATP-binding protein